MSSVSNDQKQKCEEMLAGREGLSFFYLGLMIFFPLDSTKDLTSKPEWEVFILVLVLNFVLKMKFLK